MDNIGKDKLDIMIQLAGQSLIEHNLEVGLTDEIPDVAFPKRLYRKIIRMIRHESCRPVYNDFVYRVKRIAVVFLTVCSICLALAMNVGAVREAFWNAIVEWFDDYIAVIFVPDEDLPNKIEEYKEPRLMFIGCEKRVKRLSAGVYNISYYISEKEIMRYCQTIIDSTYSLYDNETKEIIPDAVSGYDVIIINSPDEIKFMWNDGIYIYELTIYDIAISIDQIKMIAESVS